MYKVVDVRAREFEESTNRAVASLIEHSGDERKEKEKKETGKRDVFRPIR